MYRLALAVTLLCLFAAACGGTGLPLSTPTSQAVVDTPTALQPTPTWAAVLDTPPPPRPTPTLGPTVTPRPAPAGTSTPSSIPGSPTPPPPTTTPIPPTDTPGPTDTPASAPTATATSILRLVAELPAGGDTLSFSSDDALLASGSSSDQIEVWDTSTWQRLWSGSHDDSIRRIAFSPNDKYLATASFDHTARLWDAVTGDEISRLDFGYWVYGLDFSSDSQMWAAGSFDRKAILARTSDGQIIREFEHEFMVTSLALSPDGPWMAVMTTGSWGPGKVVVWDTITQEKRILAEFRGPAYSNVVFNPDTTLLAAGLGGSGPIRLWHTQIWTEAAQLVPTEGTVNRLAFSPDGQHLAAAISTGKEKDLVVVWDVETAQQIAQMEQPDVIWDLVFSPDGRWVVTGLGQGIEHPPANEAQLWEVASGTMVARMPHERQVLAVATSHDGQLIASGGHDAVKVWEFRASD